MQAHLKLLQLLLLSLLLLKCLLLLRPPALSAARAGWSDVFRSLHQPLKTNPQSGLGPQTGVTVKPKQSLNQWKACQSKIKESTSAKRRPSHWLVSKRPNQARK
jgi:hypothetical protein